MWYHVPVLILEVRQRENRASHGIKPDSQTGSGGSPQSRGSSPVGSRGVRNIMGGSGRFSNSTGRAG